MPGSLRPGDLVAGRYLIADLLDESGRGRFWRAEDQVLQRHVAVHVIPEDDDRAPGVMAAARTTAGVLDPRILRVLDADIRDGLCFVVNEWGSGSSLDIVLARDATLPPRRAAWIVSEVAGAVALCHERGFAHGRLAPENVLIDSSGRVKVIGTGVEAALWGLPPGRIASDVTDLGGLLYAALTGHWAGVSRSRVPEALQVHGRVLRPRKVRAGVPRALDDVCDEVLNGVSGGVHARSPYDLGTARGIGEALTDFVGEPVGVVVPEEVAIPLTALIGDPAEVTARIDALVADTPQIDPAEVDAPPADAAEVVAEATSVIEEPLPPSDEEATVAGLPVFGDQDVTWVSTSDPPAPPPPPEPPAQRPLFAPDPPEGEPVRRTRPGVAAPEDYWPWDRTGPHSGSGAVPRLTTTGSGFVFEEEDDDALVPGRSWLRLAMVVGALILLGLAGVFAFNLIQGRAPLEFEGQDEATPGTTAPLSQITGIVVDDIDPQASPPEEFPDLVGRAVDGDPATSWRTQVYTQQFGPTGLKTGLGLVLDLGAEYDVGRIRVDFVGSPTSVTLYASDTAVDRVAGLDPLLTQNVEERLDSELQVRTRYLVVWLTSLPPVDGGFRGEISEIAVWGRTPEGTAAGGGLR